MRIAQPHCKSHALDFYFGRLCALYIITLARQQQLLLYFGVLALGEDRERAITMITVGSIAFIPGSYASYHLYGSWRRWPGFSYDMLPSYDE